MLSAHLHLLKSLFSIQGMDFFMIQALNLLPAWLQTDNTFSHVSISASKIAVWLNASKNELMNSKISLSSCAVVFGVTWRAACSLHLPTNECEISGCSWSTAQICLSTYASFNLLLTQKKSIHIHIRTNATTAGCVVCGAAWVRKKPCKHPHTNTHKLLSFPANSDGRECNHFF